MIKSISISGIASYNGEPQNLEDLSKFNFIFGSNGSGKTTISRVVEDENAYPTCSLKWKNDVKLQTLVYNQDFINKNFNQSAEIMGIFTLGEDSVETEKEIEEKKTELNTLIDKWVGLKKGLDGDNDHIGKKGELNKLEEKLKEKCWAQKRKYDEIFKQAFTGYRNDSIRFMNKILDEWNTNKNSLKTLEYLEEKAETVFDENITYEEIIENINAENIIKHESNQILNKRIIGKEDVDIAGMIKKLGNSDWVKKGRYYYDLNNGVCPFCQQSTTETFAQSLNEYFDEAFKEEINKINTLAENYGVNASWLIKHIETIIESSSSFLDIDSLKMKKDLLDSIIETNITKIEEKKKEPGQIIELESIEDLISDIMFLIKSANEGITVHNKIYKDLENEKKELISQIWKYLLEVELKEDLKDYIKEKNKLERDIQKIEILIKDTEGEKNQTEAEIRDLENQSTSLEPTKNDINSLLSSFGFQNFSLNIADDKRSYKLIRQDGTDAAETLSEGEKNFLTFLYFYHLLKGSQSESEITNDRVVVFDDPVSSLDSDILFIVSSLIKNLFDEVRTETGYIKQIFIMTHNVYFHKQVSFNPDRSQGRSMNEETFWTVRRSNYGSKLTKHSSNPIKTSYDLLWEEIRNPQRSSLTIQNTIRRILENYFTILGGIPLKNLPDEFEGENKKICGSMISWIHDGSHNAYDDLYITIEDETVDKYLEVFKEIFVKSGHSAHYNMMMGDMRLD